jgi:hypothetical protein
MHFKESQLKESVFTIMLSVLALLGLSQPASAEKFKSVQECTPGKRVVDLRSRHGKVIKNDGSTMCQVAFDGGKTENLLFWMFNAEGDSPETNDKLVPGKYECFASGRYTFMDMYITGANTYQSAGTSGKFHVEYPSRKIVFETGSLSKYHAKLMQGPKIGLNTDGGQFYATTCELKK